MRLVYLGMIRKDTSIYESIDLVDLCTRKGMKVELFVIGSGTEEKEVKKYVVQKNLSKQVKFLGYEDRGGEIAKILARCHLGLALYPIYPYSPNWYLTSGKCRRYISQRLPIVISAVPYFAKYVHDYNAGIIIDNNLDEVPPALEAVYNNPSLLEGMRKGTDNLYKKYNADRVLGEIFNEMLFMQQTIK